MNLDSLSTPMMLNLTARWLSDAGFRSALGSAGTLGLGVLASLDQAHTPLAELESVRDVRRGHIRELSERASELGILHDRKARGFYHLLRGLIEIAEEDQTVVEHRAVLDLLFPIGLSVTKQSSIEAGDSAVALERAVTPEVRAKLAAIVVGAQTLDQLFDTWMATAHELARTVEQRAELIAQTRRDRSDGQAFDLEAGRDEWVRAVRDLLWALDVRPELADLREPAIAELRCAVETAQRRFTSGGLLQAHLEPSPPEPIGETMLLFGAHPAFGRSR